MNKKDREFRVRGREADDKKKERKNRNFAYFKEERSKIKTQKIH